MSYSNIRFESDDDGIALLTVNRPEKLNALNRDTMAELADAFTRARETAAIRALIVTGAGEKAFVAGADINELAVLSPIEARALALRGQAIFRALETLPKPTVAAINGFALGGGLELAMSCAIRVASPNAKFGQPEVKLGIVPGYGGTQRLPRLVGRGRAIEMLLSGEPIDAAEAYRIGPGELRRAAGGTAAIQPRLAAQGAGQRSDGDRAGDGSGGRGSGLRPGRRAAL